MNVNADVAMDFQLVDQVETKTRYRPIFSQLGSETLLTWQPMNGQYLLRTKTSGRGPKSIVNMFRVTLTVTLNFVSGEFHDIVSSIVHFL